MQQIRKSSHGCIWVAAGALIIVFLLVLATSVLVWLGPELPHGGSDSKGEDELPPLREIWSAGSGQTKVVRIPLQGLIMLGQKSGLLFPGAGSAEHTLRAIRRATHDPKVKAIILEVDSGGGGITSSDVIFKALQNFRQAQPDRKVVAILEDVAASGAYYVALAADYVIAHPTTVTGSIGVLIQTLNIRELGEKIGVRDVTIKSGTNKDILNPFGQLSVEQRQLLQELVDTMYTRFVQLVAERRRLPEEKVREIADGRIISAPRALELGLIDQIGYWEDAMTKTAELLGVNEIRVFRYEERFSFGKLLKLNMTEPWKEITSVLQRDSQPRLMYLWRF